MHRQDSPARGYRRATLHTLSFSILVNIMTQNELS